MMLLRWRYSSVGTLVPAVCPNNVYPPCKPVIPRERILRWWIRGVPKLDFQWLEEEKLCFRNSSTNCPQIVDQIPGNQEVIYKPTSRTTVEIFLNNVLLILKFTKNF